MTRFLMCEPKYYDVIYKINPWMTRKEGVALIEVDQQWRYLVDTINNCGADVILIEPQPEWPDLVFTANAGLIHGQDVYLSHFQHPERQGERQFFRTWFLEHGYRVLCDKEEDYTDAGATRYYNGPHFEGAGDALFAGDVLFAGHGFRTDIKVYDEIEQYGLDNIVLCELVDNNFYHLDTCFCPLNENVALWWPGAFSPRTQARLKAHPIELLAVPELEAQRFACNAVVIDKQIIIPAGCPETSAMLTEQGFTVHTCEMSEFIKSGGACKCLTLKLQGEEGCS